METEKIIIGFIVISLLFTFFTAFSLPNSPEGKISNKVLKILENRSENSYIRVIVFSNKSVSFRYFLKEIEKMKDNQILKNINVLRNLRAVTCLATPSAIKILVNDSVVKTIEIDEKIHALSGSGSIKTKRDKIKNTPIQYKHKKTAFLFIISVITISILILLVVIIKLLK